MNTLYKFDVIRNITSKYEEKSKNDEGEEVTVTKTKSEKKPVKLVIRKPNRRLYEDGELFYAVKLGEGIKAGLLTKAFIVKKFQNAMEEKDENRERKEYAELYYKLLKEQEELEKLRLNLDNEDEEYRSKKAAECVANIQSTQSKIQEYELAQNNLFDQTAEKRAQNQTIMWWVLHTAYYDQDENGNYEPVFGDGDYDKRIEEYDRLEEKNDPFWTEVVKKYAYFVTFWYLNGVNSQDQFDEVANMFSRDNFEESLGEEKTDSEGSEEAEKKEESEPEEAKTEEKSEEDTKEEAPAKKAKPKAKRGRKKKTETPPTEQSSS